MAVWLNYIVTAHGPMDAATRAARTLRTRHLIDAVGAWLTLAVGGAWCGEVLAGTPLCSAPWANLALPQSLLWETSSSSATTSASASRA